MNLRLRAASGSDHGRMRRANEDSVFIYLPAELPTRPLGLFIVADGMGGHKAGEIASWLAVSTVFQELEPFFEEMIYQLRPRLRDPHTHPTVARSAHPTLWKLRLRDAVARANDAIHAYAQHHPGEAGNLGTTVACALVCDDRAYIANVGDSRVYHLRGRRLRQLTVDHSYVNLLVQRGKLKPERVYDHPRRNVITRALGHHLEVNADIYTQALQPGDRLLICSDGLWEMVRDPEELASHLSDARDPQEAVKRLIRLANAQGGVDNISVIVCEVHSSPP